MDQELQSTEQRFDAFLSYPSSVDAALVRRTERFLEGFHKRPLLRRLKLRPLSICVDRSDLKIRESDTLDSVHELLARYLARATYLVVFCSEGPEGATVSPHVDFEVRWFTQHRSAARVLPVVTAGVDPTGTPEKVFPVSLLEAGLHRAVWIDFRARGQNRLLRLL